MIGGTFDGHPWNAGETVTIKVHDQKHPASKPLGEELTIQDEIYKFKHWQPEKVRVLASLDFEKTKHREPYHVPILWVKDYGDGKVMHMSLGHNEHVWQNPQFLASIQGGVEWILGKQAGDATPNPEVSQAEDAKAKELHGAK
jgi:type 1 glutamine amidotransferase